MEKKYEKVKMFCAENKYIENDDLKRECFKDDGYVMFLSFSNLINEYAMQVNAISETISILEGWQSKSYFKLNETKYEINWFGCNEKKGREKVTLPQAKILYNETKVKYDTLYEVFLRAGKVHYKNENELIDKYF